LAPVESTLENETKLALGTICSYKYKELNEVLILAGKVQRSISGLTSLVGTVSMVVIGTRGKKREIKEKEK
jgi:hypothetical protein